MSIRFEVVAKDSCSHARAGRLHTPHGVVETPVFMPVGTAGTVKGMTQVQLEELGAQIILANTYHLYLRPGEAVVRDLGGLHEFIGWRCPILTDSGGYQVMSLKGLGKITEDGFHFQSHLDGSSHFLSPERAVEIQRALGADIMMVLDECVEYPASHEALLRAVKLTSRWAARCAKALRESGIATRDSGGIQKSGVRSQSELWTPMGSIGPQKSGKREEGERDSGEDQKPTPNPQRLEPSAKPPAPSLESRVASPALFGIVQGGTDLGLRRQSADAIMEVGFEGYALGGLSVGEPKNETFDVAEFTAGLLPKDKPRYLMGVGTPEDLVEGVARGIDMFDCVLPTRNARNGCVFTSEGKLVIKNAQYARDERPLDVACDCPTCRRHSRAYIRHLFVAGEMLAGMLATCHNLYFYLDWMRKVRQAILSGTFGELRSGVRAGQLGAAF